MLPYVRQHTQDPGLPTVTPNGNVPHLLGVSELGVANVPARYTNANTLFTDRGYGPLGQLAAMLIAICGEVVITGVVPGIETSVVTAGGSAGVLAVTGTPAVAEYRSQFKIVIDSAGTGAVGSATFKWSRDGGTTWVETGKTTSNSYSLGSTGLTLDFPDTGMTTSHYWTFDVQSSNALGTITQSGTGPAITDNDSAPNDAYEAQIKIVLAGVLGTMQFEYSLDGGRTWTDPIVSPAGGSYTIPRTGIKLTMAAGTYVLGEVYTIPCTEPVMSTTNLATAETAIRASQLEWDWKVVAGTHATASAANTFASAMDTHMTALEGINRFAGCILDAGSGDTAATVASTYVTTSRRLMPCYGRVDAFSYIPMPGCNYLRVSCSWYLAQRAASELISTHLGRTASGQLPGIPAITTDFPTPVEHDEYTAATALDHLGFATLRSWPGRANEWYITRGRIKAPAGSDFQHWHLRRIFDVAEKTIYDEEFLMANRSFACNTDGTLDEAEAAAAEKVIKDKLTKRLLDPRNAEGRKGHVSALDYRLDRGQDVLGTNNVVSTWGLMPRAYAEFIDSYGGFTRL